MAAIRRLAKTRARLYRRAAHASFVKASVAESRCVDRDMRIDKIKIIVTRERLNLNVIVQYIFDNLEIQLLVASPRKPQL